ncbi:MAG TPA: hypothetical protein VFQ87_12705 [Bradyrhizobium sp.]|nr:hypothetical protein [Bradyrhizobium sp.]
MEPAHHSYDEVSVKKLIESFAGAPLVSSLGTLTPIDTDAVQTLLKMGKEVAPSLVAALSADTPAIVIYAAYCLGQIGDTSVLPRLQEVQEAYLARNPKSEFDFSVANAVRRAIESLSDLSP